MKRLIILTAMLALCSCGQSGGKQMKNMKTYIDWINQPEAYAAEMIPAKEELIFNMEKISLREAFVSKWNNDNVVIALCDFVLPDKEWKAMTGYIFIPGKEDARYKFSEDIKIKTGFLEIPAFAFADLDNDGKEEFIYLYAYDLKGEGYLVVSCEIFSADAEKDFKETRIKINADKRINDLSGTAGKNANHVDRKQIQTVLDSVVADIMSLSNLSGS